MPAPEQYSVRQLPHGEATIYAEREGETFHCGLGPIVEAKLLYVDQIELSTRWSATSEDNSLVVWDVGLGAGANAAAVLTSWKAAPSGHLHLVSFDQTLGPLQCALEARRKNPDFFTYLEGWSWEELIKQGSFREKTANKSLLWEWREGDFVEGLRGAADGKVQWPQPQAILYDSYSPARNWEMWKLDHWRRLRTCCGEANTTAVSFSRATGVRVTLMLAGFYVGRGCATGLKEETTLAATRMESLRDPLDLRWLERVQRSDRSHPFTSPSFEGHPISETWLAELRAHPQFANMVAKI
jgi:tRNA U34 5-methylaminomethyl-2-thiouridine-forming methyltransferase MnmC